MTNNDSATDVATYRNSM